MHRFTTLLIVLAFLLAAAFLSLGAAALPQGADYGAGITLDEASALPDVLDAPEAHTSEPVLVRGRISDVCQRKGCWTVLSDGDATVRVRFKDYGFFLPKDISGRQAYIEGVVKIETLSERDARHYASESRDGDPDSIVGPQREVGFVATGVRILPAR